jgi:hypothetical protein
MTPADEEGAGTADTAADAPAFPVGTGVADAAVGRERRLASGLREFGGRARVAGAEMAGWWEVTERERWDSVGEGARSGLFRQVKQQGDWFVSISWEQHFSWSVDEPS